LGCLVGRHHMLILAAPLGEGTNTLVDPHVTVDHPPMRRNMTWALVGHKLPYVSRRTFEVVDFGILGVLGLPVDKVTSQNVLPLRSRFIVHVVKEVGNPNDGNPSLESILRIVGSR
jgi:hypothetical protein